jgi:ribose 5-phosphate isomerase A
MTPLEEAKKSAARAALAYVPDAGILGLGTGSTARYFIEAVAELVVEGRKLRGVATSEQSRAHAESLGIPLCPPDGPWDIDLTVDGADEVSDQLDLIKGGGAAHTREKIVNNCSRKNVIVVDEGKLSARLGEKWHVPVEVLCFAHRATAQALYALGEPSLRTREDEPVVTDSGNYIYDLNTGVIQNPTQLDQMLRGIPGVVETGLFCGRADVVLVASLKGVRTIKRP